MGVNIDTVYQNVLALANKEQRGYVTPQEFNLFAARAQLDIFDQYFYDLDKLNVQQPNEIIVADRKESILEKLGIFLKKTIRPQWSHGKLRDKAILLGGHNPEWEFYKLESVWVKLDSWGTSDLVRAQRVTFEDLRRYQKCSLTKTSNSRRQYYTLFSNTQSNAQMMGLSPGIPPGDAGDIVLYFYVKPITPYWGYNVISNKALYNPNNSQSFQIHSSEESELINKILGYAGIAIKDPGIAQASQLLDNQKTNQENSK